MRTSTLLSLVLICGLLAGSGCTEYAQHSRAVVILLDTSGTYAKEVGRAQKIINYFLSTLNPGDSLAVARIDSASFSEKDIIARVTFDSRPSIANAEKRSFKQVIDNFAHDVKGSRYTDISGALLQATEFLRETGAGKRYIFIFSDLKEDLQRGFVRQLNYPLANTKVVALNVTKLESDNVDPRLYTERLAVWQQKVEADGGRWGVVNDLANLDSVFVD